MPDSKLARNADRRDTPPAHEATGMARFDMKLPFWMILVAMLTVTAAYFGQKEATSIALTSLNGQMIAVTSELTALKASVGRMEIGRYTSQDSQRDFAWRDERAVDLSKRVAELEVIGRRSR